jgi:hypothetical protein
VQGANVPRIGVRKTETGQRRRCDLRTGHHLPGLWWRRGKEAAPVVGAIRQLHDKTVLLSSARWHARCRQTDRLCAGDHAPNDLSHF